MVKMINAFVGTEMYVAEDRVQEYLDRGHRIAEEPREMPVKDAPKKPPAKTTRSRKK